MNEIYNPVKNFIRLNENKLLHYDSTFLGALTRHTITKPEEKDRNANLGEREETHSATIIK